MRAASARVIARVFWSSARAAQLTVRFVVPLAVVISTAASAASVDRDTWYFPTDDRKARLFVEELGARTAPPVIVLHGGWGAEHSYLDALVTPEAGPGHRFVLYDQRGSLLSPTKDLSALSVDQQIADLEALRRALGVDRVVIFAHSMGTFLAMAYAQAHPDHVAKLILTGALPAKTPPGGADAYFAASISGAGARLTARPAVLNELKKVASNPDPIAARQETYIWRIKLAAVNLFHIERWRDMHGGRAFFNQSVADAIAPTMPKAWDFEPALTAPGVTVELINGDMDYADFGEAYWRGFARQHQNVHLTVLRNAEHSAWLDDPAEFQKAFKVALAR